MHDNNSIISNILNWANNNPQPPVVLEIGLGPDCNQDCLFCFRKNPKRLIKRKILSLKKIKSIIDEADELGVKKIRVIGEGEPLARKNALDILRYMKKGQKHEREIETFLCTNGTLFTEEIIRTLVNIGWDEINFSIQADNPEVHDCLSGKKGSFKKIVWSLKKFKEYKLLLNKSKPRIYFGAVLLNQNYDEFNGLAKLAKENGVERFFIQPLSVNSEKSHLLKLTNSQAIDFQKIRKELDSKMKKQNIQPLLNHLTLKNILNADNQFEVLKKINKQKNLNYLGAYCFNPFWFINIRNDGTVNCCSSFENHNIESVANKSLKEVWFGQWFTNFRMKMMNDELLPSCNNCCSGYIKDNYAFHKKMISKKQHDRKTKASKTVFKKANHLETFKYPST